MLQTVPPPLATCFDRRIRARGDDYYRAGRVNLVSGNALEVFAVVRGSKHYSVTLFRKGPAIEATCTCAYVVREYELCKHIWAVLRVSQPEGFLKGLRSDPPAWVELSDDIPLSEDDNFPPVAPAPSSRPRRNRGAPHIGTLPSPRADPPTPPAPSLPKPAWKRLLQTLENAETQRAPREHPRPPGEHRVLYAIDFDASRKAGTLALTILRSQRKADGAWSDPRPWQVGRSDLESMEDPDDRRITSLLFGTQTEWGAWTGSPYASGLLPSTCVVPAGSADTLLPLLCRTGHCFAAVTTGDTTDLHPVRWDGDAGPWTFVLSLARADEKDPPAYSVHGLLRRGDERIDLSEPGFLLAGAIVLIGDRVAPLHDHDAFQWIVQLRRLGSFSVPAGEIQSFLETFHTTFPRPPLEAPPELKIETIEGAPRPHLRVGAAPITRGYGASRLPCELDFYYGDTPVPWGAREREVFDAAARRVVRRDLAAEARAADRLPELGFRRPRRAWGGDRKAPLELPSARLPQVARTLASEGWLVEAEGKVVRSPGALRVHVTSGVDWFDLTGGADYGDQTAPLPDLLAAMKRGESWVRLGDGTYGLLPEEWLTQYADLARLGVSARGHLRFQRSQIGFLDLLLAEVPEVSADEAFSRVRKELHSFDGIVPREAPASFRGTLRDYQKDGLGWFDFLERFGFGGCLADDMGLGKTVQVLALLAARSGHGPEPSLAPGATPGPSRRLPASSRKRPSLVIAPRSLIFNWKDESARFTPHLRWRDHTGIDRRQDSRAFSSCDVVITTYGTLRRDARLFAKTEFDVIVLDEAQAIKNANTQAAKAVRLLRGRRRLALSGTPIENHLGELWSLFEFLNPGMLGGATVFRSATKRPKALTGQTASPTALDDAAGADSKESATLALLARALRPFILRRTKQEVARELPERTEQTLHCTMKTEQRRLYDELKEFYRAALGSRIAKEGIERSQIQILEALLRLRQAACHPGLIDRARGAETCAKLDVLLPHLEEILAEGHKALVFSQFTSFLAIVRKRLDAAGTPYAYLDGRTRNRAEAVRQFQEDPRCPLFLISLKAGGLGLNLTAAEYVYLLDPWWNPAVEAQAIDRTHRIGQTRPVFAYRLVARDTVEERILELQAGKKELADAILRTDDRQSRGLTREDLALLLS